MTSLIDTLTDEPHVMNHEMGFYEYITRMHPDGSPITIEVEVLVDWDGTPEPEVKYYAAIQKTQYIGGGLSVNAGAVIMLTKAEIEDFQNSDEVDDLYKEEMAADADYQDAKNFR